MRERRSLNLPLADTGYSNRHKKIRKDNELLLRRLQQVKSGPFGIWSWFRKKPS